MTINYKAKYVVSNSQTVLKDKVIQIQEGKISDVIDEKDLEKGSQIEDLGNVAIVPGFVNAHSHVGLVSVKGLGHSQASALYDVMWGIEPHLTEDDVYKLSCLGILDCLSSGTTSINDHYFFSEGVAKACLDTGIRGFIGHTVMTEYGPWTGEDQLIMAESFVKNFIKSNDLIHPVMAPHATDTTNPETILKMKNFAEDNNIPIHIHLSQTKVEFDYIKENFGVSPIKHAQEIGLLGNNLIAAHCNVVEEGDLDLLASSNTYPIFCPSTHALGGKLLDTNNLLSNNANWGIGTDCSGGNDDYDMIEETRTALLLNNSKGLETKLTPKNVFEIATKQNFEKLTLQNDIYNMESGSYADFITINLDSEKIQPIHDLINNIVLSSSSKEVKDVVINGKEVIRNYEFIDLDKEKIIYEANQVLDKLLIKSNFKERIEKGEFS